MALNKTDSERTDGMEKSLKKADLVLLQQKQETAAQPEAPLHSNPIIRCACRAPHPRPLLSNPVRPERQPTAQYMTPQRSRHVAGSYSSWGRS